MTLPTATHFRTHSRFYGSAAIGVLVWALTEAFHTSLQSSLAGSTFFAVYLVASWLLAFRVTPDDLRKRAAIDDEGIGLIVLIAFAAIGLSLYSLVRLLNEPSRDPWHLALAIATVPLGWLTLHTLMAFHYAHLYYAEPDDPEAKAREAGGLDFPGDEPPNALDFLYFSFVIGMTSQVSDVQATNRQMRDTTLGHSIVSFFFNTVILALAVNVAANG